ncbi:transcription factor kayak-like isoform X2 [Portunus trituberculatus]|uniref:transcription factor kayak-like isoform X2 n=1 Tax=Portunus trituberculatus TaxID=210409 RepID=UPI001E1CE3C6|nr:transcription factor kayak-like isoform X2 [Portunus trituberculatus]UHL61878.1 c-Fos protein [Portunus trituberculatus]
MLVSESDQVTRRKFLQRETELPQPTMFTRSQAAANNSATTKSVTSSSQSFTTASVASGGGESLTTDSNSSSNDTVPSVSLTITAVAANIPERDGCITTITAPALDTPTITNLVLNSLEGVHSGVPTRTTPTLTPTTLRNIEQTFLELSSVQPPEPHTNQAGFVPPLVQPATGNTYVSVDSRCWGGGTLTQIPHTTSASTSSASGVNLRAPTAHTATSTTATLTMPSQIQVQQPRRTGGRRPIKDERITAEEEERRHLRRERNKLAAARCRKRRLDQTNMLQDETDELEEKKTELQTEIQLLQQQRDELEFLLATHKAVCRRHVPPAPSATPFVTSAAPVSVAPVTTTATVANTAMRVVKKAVVVKEEPMEDEVSVEEEEVKIPPSISNNNSRPRRPTSLNVAPVALRTPSVADLGVSIETPSTGLRGFNFDSMMEGGTGLTPVTSGTGLTPVHTGLTPLSTPVVSAPSGSSSNCGTQQRSSSSDLSSPDSVPPKLVSL